MRRLNLLPWLGLPIIGTYLAFVPDRFHIVVFGLLASSCLLICVQLHLIHGKALKLVSQSLSELSDAARESRRTWQDILTLSATDASVFLRARGLLQRYDDPVVRAAATSTLATVIATLPKATDQELTFEGEFLVWEAALALWRELVAQRRAGQPVSVTAVHLLPVELWLTERGEQSLELQEALVRSGGTVTRVIIGPDINWSESDTVRKVLARMIQRGIHVYYIPFHHLSIDNLRMGDFFSVQNGQWVYQWEGLFAIRRAQILLPHSENFDYFGAVWNRLMRLIEHQQIPLITAAHFKERAGETAAVAGA